MSKQRKIITTIWATAVLLMIGIIASWSGLNAREPRSMATNVDGLAIVSVTPTEIPSYTVPPFSLTDQEGRTITREDLKGHVWVAAFIFTRCSNTCPMMSTKMARLQKAITDPSVKLVSFSVDPTHDTPEILKGYAEKFSADPDRWHLLTGDLATIQNVSSELKLALQPSTEPNQIDHSERFVLIDRDGNTRGFYRGLEDESLAQLATDAAKLAAKGSVQ